MSEIKRWHFFGAGINEAYIDTDDNGAYVLFTDHEAAIIKEKIEVLEELNDDACFYCDSTSGEGGHWSVRQKEIVAKIAQLQAQLGEAGR